MEKLYTVQTYYQMKYNNTGTEFYLHSADDIRHKILFEETLKKNRLSDKKFLIAILEKRIRNYKRFDIDYRAVLLKHFQEDDTTMMLQLLKLNNK